jgi:hypothetical protein
MKTMDYADGMSKPSRRGDCSPANSLRRVRAVAP